MKTIELLPMESAPKDGTHIIVKRKNVLEDGIQFVQAWWWKPTELHQWESGARPHWQTNNGRTLIGETDPQGWIPLPTEVLNKPEQSREN